MNIRLFDVKNGVVIPTEHCHTLKDLKILITEYPDTCNSMFSYLFYMTCPDPDINPFVNVRDSDKEEVILEQLDPDWSTEDPYIPEALELCTTLYETPTLRAYMGIRNMLDKIADFMNTTEIKDGKDGNITALVNAAAKFDGIRGSFKGAYEDLKKEQKSQVRGGSKLAYDQK